MANDALIICAAKQREETKLRCRDGEGGRKDGNCLLQKGKTLILLSHYCHYLVMLSHLAVREEQKSSVCR